jgi:hypothetical protein
LAKHVKLYQEEGKPKTQINSNFDISSAKNASPVKNTSVAVVIRDRRPPSAREQAGPSSQSGRVIFLSRTTRLIN